MIGATAAGAGHVPVTSPSNGNGVTPRTDAPLKEVLVELWQNTEKLLHQEVALARAELDAKARTLKTEVTTAAVGGAVLYTGLLALTAAAILLLASVMTPWIAALLVGAALILAGVFMMRRQPRLGTTDLTPRETLRTVRENVHSFKEALK